MTRDVILSRGDGEESQRRPPVILRSFPFASLRVRMTCGLALMLLFAHPAAACTVCMGAPGDPLVEGANRGIWVLLAIIFAVQIGFVALFWSFWKRARDLKKFRDQFRVIHGGNAR